MKSYHLTSPMMQGEEVKTLQRRLAGTNKFKENYHPGKVDGSFGESTAGASYRAKFALGYPTKDLTRTYGQVLDNYLTGKTALPDAFAKRRRDRKKAAAAVPLRVKALNKAKPEIGTKESPSGSNRVKYSTWYGIIGPWCAMFVTWCYDGVGSKAFTRGSRYAYVPNIISAARLGGRGLALTSNPEPGDLVCFDWNRDRIADHVGIFEKWINRSAGTFYAIEGNTSTSNNSNGGQVMRRNRNRSLVQAFVRVVN
jgi:peptidoglycan hydrolase-like protein with peptidoglycan-binding domain